MYVTITGVLSHTAITLCNVETYDTPRVSMLENNSVCTVQQGYSHEKLHIVSSSDNLVGVQTTTSKKGHIMKNLKIVGETQPYRALNGHTMVAPIALTRSGQEHTVSAWAECTPDCEACAYGEWLPEW